MGLRPVTRPRSWTHPPPSTNRFRYMGTWYLAQAICSTRAPVYNCHLTYESVSLCLYIRCMRTVPGAGSLQRTSAACHFFSRNRRPVFVYDGCTVHAVPGAGSVQRRTSTAHDRRLTRDIIPLCSRVRYIWRGSRCRKKLSA